jgi:hypothetical protein
MVPRSRSQRLLLVPQRDSLAHSWSWALLEKLPIVQPLKNFPAFYRTRRFITAFIRALHWSLSWARSIQSPPSHPISLRSILILSTHLRLVRWVPFHHGKARPQVANGGNTFQVWRVATNILNKQSRTADKGWPSSLGVGLGLTTPRLKK